MEDHCQRITHVVERACRLSPPSDSNSMDRNTSSSDDEDGTGPGEPENMQNSDEEVTSPENEGKKVISIDWEVYTYVISIKLITYEEKPGSDC